jgi:hypothetical protein
MRALMCALPVHTGKFTSPTSMLRMRLGENLMKIQVIWLVTFVDSTVVTSAVTTQKTWGNSLSVYTALRHSSTAVRTSNLPENFVLKFFGPWIERNWSIFYRAKQWILEAGTVCPVLNHSSECLQNICSHLHPDLSSVLEYGFLTPYLLIKVCKGCGALHFNSLHIILNICVPQEDNSCYTSTGNRGF